MKLIFIFLLQVREDPIFRREGNHVHVDSVLSISQVNLVLLTFFLVCTLIKVHVHDGMQVSSLFQINQFTSY